MWYKLAKKTPVTNYEQSTPKITGKKDLQMLLYQLKVPIVMILGMPVGT